jgi:glycosyltransferase involved in cell wall biosynthesis
MIRVCHIASGDLWAGAEVMTFNLLRGLMRFEDMDLSAIVLNEGRLAKEIRGLGIHVHIVDERKKSFLEICGKVRKLMVVNTPDIIHSHRYKENILAYLVSRTRRETKLITTQHGMQEIQRNGNSLKQSLVTKMNLLIMSRCFKKVIAVSEEMRKTFVEDLGFSRDRVIVIHNGVEVPLEMPVTAGKKFFVLGSAGRLVPIKDYPLMVEIAKEVSRETDRILFELAGEGPEMEKILRLVKRYGLEKSFLLRGFENNLSSFYSGIDLYLNTSIHEGIPMSVLEAMAHGIPVIAPKVGGITEIIDDGVNGCLVEGRNAKDFAKRCVSLYENDMLRKQMGSAARKKIINEFSMEKMVREYYNLYMGLCS